MTYFSGLYYYKFRVDMMDIDIQLLQTADKLIRCWKKSHRFLYYHMIYKRRLVLNL